MVGSQWLPILGSVPCFPRLFRILSDCVVPQPLLMTENLLKSFWCCLHVYSLAEIRSAAKTRNKLIIVNDTPYHAAFCRLAADKATVHSRILLSHPLRIRKVYTPGVNIVTELLSCVVIKSCFHNSSILVHGRGACKLPLVRLLLPPLCNIRALQVSLL